VSEVPRGIAPITNQTRPCILSLWQRVRVLAPEALCKPQAWGIAPGFHYPYDESAEGAVQRSIPDIPLVEIDAVSAQQFAVLFLKRPGAMTPGFARGEIITLFLATRIGKSKIVGRFCETPPKRIAAKTEPHYWIGV
jgi:hypothetical protein